MRHFLINLTLIAFVFLIGVNNALAVSSVVSTPKKAPIYQVPILVYHSFGPAKSLKESNLHRHYRVTAQAFEEQMKYLKDKGYHPITFSAYVESLKNKTTLPDKAIVLTFDDGWVTQYQYAFPILKKYNFTATFFIVTNYVNFKYQAYMNWDQVLELDKNGFEIGSHTVHHFNLSKISDKFIKAEIFDSKKVLENKLKHNITTLAYPDYIQNATIRNIVKSAGYTGARAGWGNFVNSSDHLDEIKSQEVVNNSNPFSSKRLPDLP